MAIDKLEEISEGLKKIGYEISDDCKEKAEIERLTIKLDMVHGKSKDSIKKEINEAIRESARNHRGAISYEEFDAISWLLEYSREGLEPIEDPTLEECVQTMMRVRTLKPREYFVPKLIEGRGELNSIWIRLSNERRGERVRAIIEKEFNYAEYVVGKEKISRRPKRRETRGILRRMRIKNNGKRRGRGRA